MTQQWLDHERVARFANENHSPKFCKTVSSTASQCPGSKRDGKHVKARYILPLDSKFLGPS